MRRTSLPGVFGQLCRDSDYDLIMAKLRNMDFIPQNADAAVAPAPPVAIAELIEQAHAAVQRQAWHEAQALWNQILQHAPQHVVAMVGLGNALRELGLYDSAEQILSAAADDFPDHELVAIARGWAASARRDWPAAAARWKDVCTRFPTLPQGYRGLVQLLRGASRHADFTSFIGIAEALLAAAPAAEPMPKHLLDLRFELARLRADWVNLRRLAEDMLLHDLQPAASTYLALSQACWNLNDTDAADAAAIQALAINPALTEAVIMRSRIATERGDSDTALFCYQTLAALNPGNSVWARQRVQLLNWLGEIEQSMTEAEALLKRWPDDPLVRVFLRNFGPALSLLPQFETIPLTADAFDPDAVERRTLQSLLDRAPPVPPVARSAIANTARSDVIIAPGPPARTAVLVFTGAGDAVTMPLPVLDRYLIPLAATPIYLRDFNRLRYLCGIRSLSDDYQGSITRLRTMLNEMGFSRLCTFGNCVGGFAAIRYGVELGAERIVAVDMPSYSPAGTGTKFELGYNFLRSRLLQRVPAEMTDLKPFLASRDVTARIDLFYLGEDVRGREHAERLGGISNVHLHPQRASPGQGLLRQMALESDNFSQWLAEFLDVDFIAMHPDRNGKSGSEE